MFSRLQWISVWSNGSITLINWLTVHHWFKLCCWDTICELMNVQQNSSQADKCISTVVSLFCCSVVSLFHCFVVPLFRCSIVSLFHCFVVLLFRCFVVPLFRCFIVLLFCCFVVMFFRCSVVPLFRCFVVPLFRCSVVSWTSYQRYKKLIPSKFLNLWPGRIKSRGYLDLFIR